MQKNQTSSIQRKSILMILNQFDLMNLVRKSTFCMQCLKHGIHYSHPQHLEQLPKLIEHIKKTDQECEDLINTLNKFMDSIQQSYNKLIGGIRTKYQRSKQQFLSFNPQYKNSFFAQTIQIFNIQY